MKKAVSYVLFSVFVMSGCASVPDYIQPAAEVPTAKVRVVHKNPDAYYAFISKFNSSCEQESRIGWVGNAEAIDTVRVGMLDDMAASHSNLERKFEANKELIIGPRMIYPNASWTEIMLSTGSVMKQVTNDRQPGLCRLPKFVPAENSEYEVVIDPNPGQCEITVYKVEKAVDGKISRIPLNAKYSNSSIKVFDLVCDQ